MVDKILSDVAKEIAVRDHYDNWIGGKWVPAVRGMHFDNVSPVNGRVICTVARSTAEDVELALDAAHAARVAWGRTSAAVRANMLNRIADRIESRLPTLALVEAIDNGKPIRETTLADLPLAVDHFRYFAGCIRAQEGGISEIDHDTVAYHFHEPLGVVAQIIPWNFPLLMAVWKLAPALAAGNCVVIKPAEQTPMGIAVLMDMLADILPPGVVNVVQGFGVEAGKPLAQSKRVAKVAFTGETTTGRLIMQYASENIIPVTLELGGKSPNIFFKDVMAEDDDFLDKALEGFTMFALNQGEVCTCPSRALVHESIYDRFMERAVARVGKIVQGNPLDMATMVGAQASNDQLEKILSYFDIGAQEGAKALIGGKRAVMQGDLAGGYYVEADRARGPQQDARVPGGDLRPGRVRDQVQGRRGSAVDRQRHALRPGRRRLVTRRQPRLPLRPGGAGRPGLDQLLPPLSGPRGVRRLQGVRHRAREPPHDARPLPADQEHAGQLQPEGDGLLLDTRPERALRPLRTRRSTHGRARHRHSGGRKRDRAARGAARAADVPPVRRVLRRQRAHVLPAHEFRVGAQDVRLGEIAGAPFYIGAAQFDYWEHTQLVIDVVPGRGSGFSLEAPEGVRFLTRSRVFTDQEADALREAGPPAHGDAASR